MRMPLACRPLELARMQLGSREDTPLARILKGQTDSPCKALELCMPERTPCAEYVDRKRVHGGKQPPKSAEAPNWRARCPMKDLSKLLQECPALNESSPNASANST